LKEKKFYVSHIVRPLDECVYSSDGKKVSSLFIQVVSLENSNKKSICWVENGKKTFFNSRSDEEFNLAVKVILSKYSKFKFEILQLDHQYDAELSTIIVSNFISGSHNMQEKIDEYF
jgi:hypothetical protein